MTLELGDKAVNFSLPNANKNVGGESLNLEDSIKSKGLVVVFECNHCPYVVASIDRMNDLANFCSENDLGFVGINSNDASVYANDSYEHMIKRANKGMPYPYLYDESQTVAHAYGAKRTPEFFLFDNTNALVYRGRMDDSPKDPSQVSSTDLKNAIDAMLSGSAIEVRETESIGCSVKWKV